MNVQRPKKNIRCHALPYSLETESLTELMLPDWLDWLSIKLCDLSVSAHTPSPEHPSTELQMHTTMPSIYIYAGESELRLSHLVASTSTH